MTELLSDLARDYLDASREAQADADPYADMPDAGDLEDLCLSRYLDSRHPTAPGVGTSRTPPPAAA